ncbi:MAG: hypothetical protein ACKO46_04280 [Alphaproteobacteria bacterium]
MKFSIFITLLFGFFLCSCSTKFQKILPAIADKELIDETNLTSEEYRAGWKDGCEVGISGGANTFYKMFYRNTKIDGYRMAYSTSYRDAWDSAFWYCFRHTYIRQKSSIFGSIFRGFR